MREMYQNGAEMSPGSPDVNLEHANGSDPFYDRLVSRIDKGHLLLSSIDIIQVSLVPESGPGGCLSV